MQRKFPGVGKQGLRTPWAPPPSTACPQPPGGTQVSTFAGPHLRRAPRLPSTPQALLPHLSCCQSQEQGGVSTPPGEGRPWGTGWGHKQVSPNRLHRWPLRPSARQRWGLWAPCGWRLPCCGLRRLRPRRPLRPSSFRSCRVFRRTRSGGWEGGGGSQPCADRGPALAPASPTMETPSLHQEGTLHRPWVSTPSCDPPVPAR